ncbi:MAG: hypothetical protein JWQ54_1075 [Mucilaginibacter sp.]|nr:hypothetical protein [Mucilaginibacter sp.]
MKRAIRYLRFSNLGQSNGSIERQELYTDQWLQFNQVHLIDTFIDRGHSAKTFDRPDFLKLTAFITKHQKNVDYLVVDQLDRFSRDAGEAMTLVKRLQKQYSIQIVSVTEGITFDYDTPGSYFRTGLQLLLAEEDNINRSIKIRGGNYTARAKEGRFLSNLAPFGYKKVGEGKNRTIVIEEKDAKIIQFIYESYLRNVPLYELKNQAKTLGFNRGGNMAIERILTNPVYAGMVKAKAFKEYPGGLFPGIHEPIIDKITWQIVQNKIAKPQKTKSVLDDNIPLRGILRCHCGQPLSGAPSRGKTGKWFYYYKCKFPQHNNVSAIKSHNQFLEVCELMSLSQTNIKYIKETAEQSLETAMNSNKKALVEKKEELEKVQEKLFAVEEKWISSQISRETYDRWSSNYNGEIFSIKGAVERLGKDHSQGFKILAKHLNFLTDIKYIYGKADTIQKREFVNLVFDSNLYYQNGVYRTPTMMEVFAHNSLIMREKNLLIYDKKRDNQMIIPSGGAGGIRTLVQTWYKVSFLHA